MPLDTLTIQSFLDVVESGSFAKAADKVGRPQSAIKMQNSEAILFENGGSDYFLLNMREEQRANAKIRNVNEGLDYYRALANAYAASMKLDKLGIDRDPPEVGSVM